MSELSGSITEINDDDVSDNASVLIRVAKWGALELGNDFVFLLHDVFNSGPVDGFEGCPYHTK